jgi:hypothetical protein
MGHRRRFALGLLVVLSAAFPAQPVAARQAGAQQPAAQSAAPPQLAAQPPAARPVLSAQRLDDRIIVRVDDRTFTCYRFGVGQKYPYFYPVNGPVSGVSVTTESSLPWPHHRSLFFGSDKVNGGNYWQEGNEQGQIVSQGPTVVAAGPDHVLITDRCEWRKPGAAPILIDRREIRIEAPSPRLRTLRFRVTLEAQTEVRIERTNHSLFAARVAPELSAQSGGVLRNAAGALGEKGTFGEGSPWCDVSGTRFGLREGIAIFDSPKNRWYPRGGSPATTASSPPRRSTGSTTRGCGSPPARGSSSTTRSSCTPVTPPRRGSQRCSRPGRRGAEVTPRRRGRRRGTGRCA